METSTNRYWPNEDLRAVLSTLTDTTLIVDHRGQIAFATEHVRDIFGYSPEELVGRTIETLIPERFRPAHVGYRNSFSAAPKRRSMGCGEIFYGRHKDGHEVPVEVGLSPMGSGSDRVTICAVRDLSQRLRLENAMRQAMLELEQRAAQSDARAQRSAEYLRLFVEHTPAAVAMLDRDMRYIATSKRWLQDYGFADRNIIGTSHYELFPEIPERWKQMHRRGLAGESLKSDDDTFVRQDGRCEWVHWEIIPWRHADGEIGGIILFTEVITQRKRAELALRQSHEELEKRVAERTFALEQANAKARQANEAKSRFLAAASHDLRQPLQAAKIYMAALALQLDRSDRNECRKTCERAGQSLDGMADILDALLDISKLESGTMEVHPSNFHIDEVLERVVLMHQPLAERKGLQLMVAKSDCVVHSDRLLLERVIDNFVANAIRYTEKGRVTVACERCANKLRISVSDTGIGIPPDQRKAIFEAFVQVDNRARASRRGFGLGLYIAKLIADTLGLRIDVKSAPGQGSTFSVDVDSGSAAERKPESRTGPCSPQHVAVLLVEDDEAVTESMLLFLKVAGIDVKAVTRGEAAIELIQAGFKPDFIVSDFRLPTYDGVEVIQRVRAALGTQLPAVLMTGEMETAELNKVKPAGTTMLRKPADPDMLVSLIQRPVP
jgi:PAS domain S-box-containing protein